MTAEEYASAQHLLHCLDSLEMSTDILQGLAKAVPDRRRPDYSICLKTQQRTLRIMQETLTSLLARSVEIEAERKASIADLLKCAKQLGRADALDALAEAIASERRSVDAAAPAVPNKGRPVRTRGK